ncbi:MAG: GrpB family protein [Gemmatimonadetes bacterium]|nr:GrpB family protein [Gemmatimonadota bacterium]MYG83709.1 GrpB family protein [Gemmatimonadota bacterium]MYJ91082.1 GrpB family protein [Gemmatimonadota bacterium]
MQNHRPDSPDPTLPFGLNSGELRLSPYRDEWPALYESEQETIESAIGNHIEDIQHVGSTAIVGMPAKPILDIAIAVEDFEMARVCIAPLAALGYTFKGENGIPRRHYFTKGEPCTHHIHMGEETSDEWAKLILFRDYLRSDQRVSDEYARLKSALLDRLAGDRVAYQAAKTEFIKEVLQKARATRS